MVHTNYYKTRDILYAVGCDVIDGVVVAGQDRVVVAPDAGGGELTEDIPGLMQGHQTHTEQREAETDTTDNALN